MKSIIEGPPAPGPASPLWRRLAWFAGLAAAGAATTAMVAYILRVVLPTP